MQPRIKRERLILFLMTILLLSQPSCRPKAPEVANTSANAPTPADPQADFYVAKDLPEPYLIEINPVLQQAWRRFIKDSHFRLARLSDMKFSESEKQTLRYWQSTEAPNDGGIAAIVIDNQLTQDAHFGIVVFRAEGEDWPPKTYSIYWLCKGVDLSRASLRRASGYLSLDVYQGDGTKKTCGIPWVYRKHRYVLGGGCV
jgi:hypothetical protein